jgi:hypothetical protein
MLWFWVAQQFQRSDKKSQEQGAIKPLRQSNWLRLTSINRFCYNRLK